MTLLNKIIKLFFVSSFAVCVIITKIIPHAKTISISPGGFLGYYSLGVVDYLKEHYDLSDVLYTGASAGSWISIVLAYKGDHKNFINKLDIFCEKIIDAKSFQCYMKTKILENFVSEDFDLHKVFIGTTKLNGIKYSKEIHCGFLTLKDTLECCEASSHVPFVSGNIFNKYKKEYHFDGGFSNYPYLETNNNLLHVNHDMWKDKKVKYRFSECIGLFYRGTKDLKQLYEDGYNDTEKNKNKLDKLFRKKKTKLFRRFGWQT